MTDTEVTESSRVLVVANQTLGGDQLFTCVQDRMAQGPCDFWLLVPATSGADRGSAARNSGLETLVRSGMTGADREEDYAHARSRLDYGLTGLRGLGAVVDGDVGDPDPMKAIEEALARRRFDEIILSTLPAGVSRWLRQDLPHRVERRFHLPVTVVTAGR
jgi:hypothetical protein